MLISGLCVQRFAELWMQPPRNRIARSIEKQLVIEMGGADLGNAGETLNFSTYLYLNFVCEGNLRF